MLESHDDSNQKLDIGLLRNELTQLLTQTLPKINQMDNTSFLELVKSDFLSLIKKGGRKETDNINQVDSEKEDDETNLIVNKKLSSSDMLAFEEFSHFFETLVPENFKMVKIPFEKSIYGFLSNQSTILKIFKIINNIYEFISKRTVHIQNNNQVEDKNNQIENYKIRQSTGIENGYEMLSKETEYKEEKPESQQKDTVIKVGKYDAKNKYIVEKFYNPFVVKMNYKLKLNENLGEIKRVTRENAKSNFVLKKKKQEIEKISNETILYNNPSKRLINSIRN